MPKRANSTSFGQKSGNPQGRGPAKGAPNAGRPTKSFKHFLANVRASAKAQLALQAAAEDSESKGFKTAWTILSAYDDEKPAEKRQIVGPVEVHVKFAREGRRTTAS